MLKSIQQMMILALSIALPIMASANTLNENDAKKVAAEFFQSGKNQRLASTDALTLAQVVTDDSTPVSYIFVAKDGQGFIIVSADDTAMPVVAYSTTSTWSKTTAPEAASQVLSKRVIAGDYGTGRHRIARMSDMDSKVLTTPEWSQEAPFNNNIPNRRLTGCVGVALAEILKYNSYPVERPAALVKNGEVAAYSWDNMRNDNYRSGYTPEEGVAVATLVADAAVAIGTDFGMSSSSAFEVKVPYALASMFGYDAAVSYKKRSEMDKASWEALIVNEINEGRPVLYSGQDVSSGHAFVCDGYQFHGGVMYFHINWGWGGSANGFYASDALNPVVSRAHSYNDLTTVVYNIKPSTNAVEWSPIHITSDERQVGLTLDVSEVPAEGTFTVRAGALKNISNQEFNGRLTVALFGVDRTLKGHLNSGRNFKLSALQTQKYADFTCSLPAGISIADGDVVRLATQASESAPWLPVEGDLLARGSVPAKGGEIPYFAVNIPSSTSDVEVTAIDNKVIKGRDFSFKVTPKSVDKVITVKANGFILTPATSNEYKITNVVEDQNIDIIVQNAADVLSKMTLWVEAGKLQDLLDENTTSTVVDLTLFGTINANDFTFMRERMKLSRLDISQVNIAALGSNPANAIPAKAFSGYRSLKTIVLPSNVTTFKSGCFNATGLTSIEIPASVGTYEYNIFLNCNALREVIVRRQSPAWVNWCVFTGTPRTKLVVPVGASAAYKAKENWQDFKEVVEENPVATDTYTVTVQEKAGLNFTPVSEGTEFAKGSTYSFKVEADESYDDYLMEVYGNATRILPDNEGVYSHKLNRNTLIHIEFKAPQATGIEEIWKISGVDGGIGLVTEVQNVLAGQSFTVRVDAIKIPAGFMSKLYAVVLTDKDGRLKEVISNVMNNYMTDVANNIKYNFSCKVNESKVREGDQIWLATAMTGNATNRVWSLIKGETSEIIDHISARGNNVAYHTVNMPASTEQYTVEGGTTSVAHGMPMSFKVTPKRGNYRVTVTVNDVEKATKAAVAHISIPAVTEDLDIKVSWEELQGLSDAEMNGYVVLDVKAGQLANVMKANGWPEKLKLVGSLNTGDFDAFKNNNTKFKELDLSDVKIDGNTFPSYAFYVTGGSRPALKKIIMPPSVTVINTNAFIQCIYLTDVVLPSSLTKIGSYAFSTCVALNNVTIDRTTPPTVDFSGLPTNRKLTIYVPASALTAYNNANMWNSANFTKKAIPEPVVPKTYYSVKLDESKFGIYSLYSDIYGNISLDSIAVGDKQKSQIWLTLPNASTANLIAKPAVAEKCRPGVAFKLYDNDIDPYDVPEVAYDMYQNPGSYKMTWDPNDSEGFWRPQNHELELYFYYPVNFQNGRGAEGFRAQIVNLKENEEWKDVPMSRFGAEGTPTLYKEGSSIQFRLTAPENIALSDFTVKVEQKVMTKSGLEPEYEYQKYEVMRSTDDIYTIPTLMGETTVKISINDGTLTVEDVLNADGAPEDVTEVILAGEFTDEAFEALRENYQAVEVIDLSNIENESIPEDAFAGMENLQSVIVPPTVTEIGAGCFKDCGGLETLNLSGVTSIGDGAFDGCTGLTSIILPATSSTEAPVQTRAPRANGGITAESFRGLNPNCLIYMADTDIPDAEHLNIILNVEGRRIAASDIVINPDYSFNAPASFSLGKHSISMTVTIPGSEGNDVDGGWKGIILPFTPTGVEYGVEFSKRPGSGINLFSFADDSAETLSAITGIEANRPYMANVCAPVAAVPVTFFANGKSTDEEFVYDVAFSPVYEEAVAVGKEYSLYGSFDGVARAGGHLVLNAEGTKFETTSEESVLRPFETYLCANEAVSASEFIVGNHPMWIYNPESAVTKLYRTGKIELTTATEGATIYYTIDGSDPSVADGTRSIYEAPFNMTRNDVTLKAVAEYKGNLSECVDIEIELFKATADFNLVKNWNWVSHSIDDGIAVSDFATSGISRIISQTQEAVIDAESGLSGDLQTLAPAVAYKVCVTSDTWNHSATGVAFDPSTEVSLKAGWTWIGAPVDPESSLNISDLFSNLNAEEGDMIVGLEGFAQVAADGTWVGTFNNLTPGTGYMYFSNSDKSFTYNLTPAVAEPSVLAETVSTEWVADIHRYPSVMPVTAILVDDAGVEVDASGYQLAAFCGNECRGVGAYVDGIMMINIHGQGGEQIDFRFIAPEGADTESKTKFNFAEKPEGTLAAPAYISLSTPTSLGCAVTDDFGIITENGNITFTGDISAVLTVEVYDTAGTKVAESVKGANGQIGVENLANGVYIIVINTTSENLYHKVMVK